MDVEWPTNSCWEDLAQESPPDLLRALGPGHYLSALGNDKEWVSVHPPGEVLCVLIMRV